MRGRAPSTGRVVVVALVLAGCSGGDSGDGRDGDRAATPALVIEVTPGEALADQVLAVEVEGAEPGAEVAVEVRSTDADGVDWASTTRVEADAEGRVAIGPEAGDGPAEQPMGPFTILAADEPDAAYAWGSGPRAFTVTARADGHDPATDEVHRRLVADGVTEAPTDPAVDGVVGTVWTPAPGAATGSAVLLVGGSEGGIASPSVAAALASRGVTTLALAYFGAPGVPAALERIPLETFATGLRIVAARPGVDPDRVWIVGGSRGTEPAVLVAARHPELVAGVVLGSPSSVVNGALTDPAAPAWTDGGQAVPFAPFGTVAPGADPGADLPIERVDGPVIATCGGDDPLWPACRHGEALFARLDDPGRPAGDHLVADDAAGHLVSVVTPFLTLGDLGAGLDLGGDALADDRVRAEAWPRVREALGAGGP